MATRRFSVAAAPVRTEHRRSFACFGGRCSVIVADTSEAAGAAATMAEQMLLDWHDRFSRFNGDSELSRLNRDPRAQVPVSPLMRRMVQAALTAAAATNGVVDGTLAPEIERAGYAAHFDGDGVPLHRALSRAPRRRPAAPHPDQRWRLVSVDPESDTVIRPPGLRLDLGGIAKGVFADVLAGHLDRFDAYAVDCAGDVRVGGRAGLPRPVQVDSPFDAGEILATFPITSGSVATSGIGRRSWVDADGRPAHHLLDPATGAPAFTGIVQASALGPTAAEAEMLAKAALLSGPAGAAEWLPHGGLIVFDDGTCQRARAASHSTISPSTSSRSGSLRISWRRPS